MASEAKYFFKATYSTKAKGFVDDEDDFLASYEQFLLERAKRLEQEDTSHYFSSSAMLDYSSDNFSAYDSTEEEDSLPTTTCVDESQLKDNDLNLSGDDVVTAH